MSNKTYPKKYTTIVFEERRVVYSVDVDSKEQAKDDYAFRGEVINSEITDHTVIDVDEESDDHKTL